jgi:hypothetical protein
MSYQGKKLRLHKDCIFVRLDGKSVVFDHKRRKHFTPQNESASMVLDFLSRKAEKDKDKGTSFEDITNQLIGTFQINKTDAEAALNAFLTKLNNFELLETPGNSEPEPPDPNHYPPHHGTPAEAQGDIVEGGTVVMVGYLITWYWG